MLYVFSDRKSLYSAQTWKWGVFVFHLPENSIATQIIWNFCATRFVYSLQFIYLFNHFYHYVFLFYTFPFFRFSVIQHSFIHFVAEIVLVPVSYWHPSINVDWVFCLLICLYFLSTSSPFGTTRCFILILCISCLNPGIDHFSKEPRFLLSENDIRNQDLSANCALCSWSLISFRPFQLT